MPKENNEEMQITPDLDQAMREGQPTFDGGDPNDNAAAAPLIPGPTGPADEEETEKKTIPETEDASGKTQEELPARNKQEDTPPETGFRFKDQTEAEKGYRELQGKATRAEQRAKAVEVELARVKNAEKTRAEAEAARATIIDFAATRRAQALEEIDALDPEDDAYRKKAATILSQADIDIYDHYQTHGRTIPENVPATPPETETGDAAPEIATITQYVQEKIVEAGVAADDPLFWQYAGRAPVADAQGKPTSLDTQIQWAVSQVTQYHDSIRAKLKSEDEARIAEDVRKKQMAAIPLGRGTPAGTTAAGEKTKAANDMPVSLADAIDFAQDRRRL